MSLNCLGSICSKICDSCSFNICNSNKNVLIIGSTENANLNNLISGNLGLPNIVSQLGGQLGGQLEIGIQLTPTRSIHILAENEHTKKIRDMAVRSAIVEISLRETCKLMQVNESFENGWKKFLLAQAECNMDLAVMWKEAEALSQADVNKLHKAVDKVARYYLSGIYLWKIFCENDFDVASIKRHSRISNAQVIFVKKQLKKKHKSKGVDNFWNLNIEVQKIYLDGAVKYFKEHIHDYCRLVRTYAFDVIAVEGQKSNDNFLHDQVVRKAHETPRGIPQLGEHKEEGRLQIELDGTCLDASSLSNREIGSNRNSSVQRSTQQQSQIQEISVAFVRSSGGGVTPEVSSRGSQEDSSFIPKPPLSLNKQP